MPGARPEMIAGSSSSSALEEEVGVKNFLLSDFNENENELSAERVATVPAEIGSRIVTEASLAGGCSCFFSNMLFQCDRIEVFG